MMITSRSCTNRSQSGQTTVEFALALIVVVAGICALYQALHFELDVFNRLLQLRQAAFHELHANQDSTRREMVAPSTDFRMIAELTPAPVPFQFIDPSLRFDAKSYHAQRGTRYWDEWSPIREMNNQWADAAMLSGEHYQGSAGLFHKPFDLTSFPVPCSFSMSRSFYLPLLSYEYIDQP